MTRLAIDGKRIRFSSGQSVCFEFEVAQVMEFGDVIVAKLDIPAGTISNRNVFGVAADGSGVLWQVPEKKLVYEDSPYTGLSRKGADVVLHNWDGLELWIDARSGQVTRERQRR